tara:strand:- start:3096 stop:5990 length:2895 start_codon:yes stop_codon:yes gene_type:complete
MRKEAVTIAMVLLILLQVGNNIEIYALEDEKNIILKQQNQGDEQDISLDILLVGNSYTSFNELNQKVEMILDTSGVNSDVEAVTGGGMKLSDHLDDANQQGNELNEKLSEGHDYVVLQDQSQVPSLPTSSEFWIDSKNAVEELNERIISEGGQSILLMTWGRKDGDTNYAERNPDYLTMQLHLQQGYEMYLENSTNENKPIFLAPVGLAYKNLYHKVNDTGVDPTGDANAFSTLYSNDGSHPSIDGSYLSSCVLYSVLTGESPVGEYYPSQISPERALELQQAAASTVFNETPNYTYPFEIQSPGIEFGPDSGSVFAIDPGLLINLNINYTNLEEFNDIANIKIIGPDDWQIAWNYSLDVNLGFDFNAPSDITSWIQFSITAPITENGMPLANSLHQFSMELVSNSTGIKDWYNFSMKYGYFHGAEIIEGGGTYSISPYDVATIEMRAKNIGNTQRDLAVSIRPLDENGSEIGDYSQAFALEEWNVFIQDKMELSAMWPNETGKIRFQIQSPLLVSGSIFFEIKIWSVAVPEEAVFAIQRVNIVPRSGGNLELNNVDCQFETSPGETCRTELIVENTGDITYDFELKIKQIPEWINVNLSQNQLSLNAGEINNQIYLNVSIKNGTPSGEVTDLIVELWVDGWNPSSISFQVKSGDYFDWSLVEELYEHNYDYENRVVNVSASWTLTNIGNTNDGLVVNLDCNIFTDYELEIPQNAEIQSTLSPRSFEILDINIGESVSFVAWMNISYDEISESMFNIEKPTLTIEARSIRDPRIIFQGSESEDNDLFRDTGVSTDNDKNSKIIEFFRIWQTVIISLIVVLFGSIGVVKAIQYRLKEDRKRMGLPIEESETVNDWMLGFTKKTNLKVNIESITIDSKGFEEEFIQKSKVRNIVDKVGPSKFRVEKASSSLDRAMTEDALDDIVELADDFSLDRNIHPNNKLLEKRDEFESRISKLEKKNKTNDEG